MDLHYAKTEVEASRAASGQDCWGWGITDDWLQLQAEVERQRAMLTICYRFLAVRSQLTRKRPRLTYEWDKTRSTMSYFIDGKPYSISLEDALAVKAAEAEEPTG